jgi:cytidylate kinase
MEHYAITINRQFGSLGRPIAQKLANLLSIEFYDRDIVDNACKSTGFSVKEVSDLEENAKTDYLYMRFPLGKVTTTRQNYIFDVQKKFIKKTAEQEDCIIVGRCAEHILEDKERLLRIYIYAPYEQRLKNCTDILKLDHDTALKMIDSVDKARNVYHRKYTGYLPSDMDHVDLMVNSALLGVDGTAEMIAHIAKQKFHLD